ncbi:MGR2/ROMO1 family protein, partial [Salmonella sp. s51933]|uniref:MGR2/ROMO1 family protein n=1 Tax=Salmonella sp. s51933 TaxID=3160127 RepID=UPI0037541D54
SEEFLVLFCCNFLEIMQRGHQVSCFDRVKMGFMIGCAVGMSAAGLFGTYAALRAGLRGRELMGMIGKTMAQGGGTFGVFMSVGTAIRC